MTNTTAVPTITIVEPWEPIGDPEPRDRLLATIEVDGCMVHLEAIRVFYPDGLQEAVQDDMQAALYHMFEINGDGPFKTATITANGVEGDYVIVATSYAD